MVHIMPLGATSELDQHPKNTSHHRQVHLVSNGTEARTAASHTLPQLKIDNQKGKHSNLYACICTLCTYIHVWTLCTYIHVWNCIYTHDTCHTYKFCTCVCIYIIMILCYVFFHLCTCQARPNSPVLADPEVKDQRESKLPKKPDFQSRIKLPMMMHFIIVHQFISICWFFDSLASFFVQSCPIRWLWEGNTWNMSVELGLHQQKPSNYVHWWPAWVDFQSKNDMFISLVKIGIRRYFNN